MAKFSTGLRDGMLNNTGFKAAMDGCVLTIYSTTGDIPSSADAEVVGTPLMVLTAGGSGLTFAAPSGGVIGKSGAEIWMTDSILQSGTCAYFRLAFPADSGLLSTTEKRVQGVVGLAGTDMVVTNLNVTAGLPWTLNYFNLALPTQ